MKILKRIVLAVVLLGVLALGAIAVALYGSRPSASGDHQVAGLNASLEIRFDEYERPYVHAQTLEDALFAQGWLHARNRLWQMDMFRRAGKGRIAELLGSSMLDADKELWRLGVPQLANELEANASPETRALVEAYVNGINAALAAQRIPPPEYVLLQASPQPWTVLDVFALGAVMAYQSANNFENELLRMALFDELGPDRAAIFLPDEHRQDNFPYVLPAAQEVTAHVAIDILRRMAAVNPLDNDLLPRFAFGSNGWVVAPEKSETGNALFAFDSHDALGLPNLFYEVHLFFGEGRQIRGWSAPGLPGVINGYNERIAWGFTNIGDSQDLFIETRAEDDPLRFKDGDDWYQAETETVEIPVSGRDEPERLTIVYTKNGPLISEDPPIALRWTIQDLNGLGLDSLLDLNLAQNWEEFTDALDRFAAPPLNATYADVDGNIGFRTGALLPKRGRGDGLLPLPGDDPANRWQGILDPAEQPEALNPPEGFLAAANARVQPEGDGPLVSADNAPGYRVRRIQSVLSSKGQLTVDDMRALQMDWHDTQAELLLPTLLQVLDNTTETALEKDAHAALAAWQANPIAAPDSAPALIFQVWYPEIARAVFEPALSESTFNELMKNNYPLNHALDRLILREPGSPWWRDDRPGVIRMAFKNALEKIGNELGGNVSLWRLDRMHRVILEHELGKAVPQLAALFNLEPAPWGGSVSTVGRARYRYDRGLDVTGGATVRVVGDMRAVPAMKAVMPAGQSGHPLSAHYGDQFEAWLDGRLLPIAADWTEIDGAATTLQPAAN